MATTHREAKKVIKTEQGLKAASPSPHESFPATASSTASLASSTIPVTSSQERELPAADESQTTTSSSSDAKTVRTTVLTRRDAKLSAEQERQALEEFQTALELLSVPQPESWTLKHGRYHCVFDRLELFKEIDHLGGRRKILDDAVFAAKNVRFLLLKLLFEVQGLRPSAENLPLTHHPRSFPTSLFTRETWSLSLSKLERDQICEFAAAHKPVMDNIPGLMLRILRQENIQYSQLPVGRYKVNEHGVDAKTAVREFDYVVHYNLMPVYVGDRINEEAISNSEGRTELILQTLQLAVQRSRDTVDVFPDLENFLRAKPKLAPDRNSFCFTLSPLQYQFLIQRYPVYGVSNEPLLLAAASDNLVHENVGLPEVPPVPDLLEPQALAPQGEPEPVLALEHPFPPAHLPAPVRNPFVRFFDTHIRRRQELEDAANPAPVSRIAPPEAEHPFPPAHLPEPARIR